MRSQHFTQAKGLLCEEAFRVIATGIIPIGGARAQDITQALLDSESPLVTATSPKSPALMTMTAAVSLIRGTLSIIQQAVRYGRYYGANAVIVTDYDNAVILHGINQPLTDDKEKLIQWDFVAKKDIRLAVATMFWIACQEFKKDLETAAAEEGEEIRKEREKAAEEEAKAKAAKAKAKEEKQKQKEKQKEQERKVTRKTQAK